MALKCYQNTLDKEKNIKEYKIIEKQEKDKGKKNRKMRSNIRNIRKEEPNRQV